MNTNTAVTSLPRTNIPKSLRMIAERRDSITSAIIDRRSVISAELVDRLVDRAVSPLRARRPRMMQTGQHDLDLLTMLVPLLRRGALITIPNYEAKRPHRRGPDTRTIGELRFGKLSALISNQTTLSFSVRLFDHSVADRDGEEDTVGAHRTFLLTDLEGRLKPDWQQLQFRSTEREGDFITKQGLAPSGTLSFSKFVHPNRRQSLFGAPYLRLKLMEQRLREEIRFYERELGRLSAFAPRTSAPASASSCCSQCNKAKNESIKTFVVEIDAADFTGHYPPLPENTAGYRAGSEHVKELRYRFLPLVQFVIRATEAAYYYFGLPKSYVAPWLTDTVIEDEVRLPGKRVRWNRIELAPGLNLRFRPMVKQERVAA